MTCCDWPRMESSAPMRLGSGSLRERVKALGNLKCRTSAANSGELIRSVSWEKKLAKASLCFFDRSRVFYRQTCSNNSVKQIAYCLRPILSSVH